MEAHDTHLKIKLDEHGEMLTTVIGDVCILFSIMNYEYFLSWDVIDGWLENIKFSFEKCMFYFRTVVALIVSTIPEGPPISITTCFDILTGKITQNNVIL